MKTAYITILLIASLSLIGVKGQNTINGLITEFKSHAYKNLCDTIDNNSIDYCVFNLFEHREDTPKCTLCYDLCQNDDVYNALEFPPFPPALLDMKKNAEEKRQSICNKISEISLKDAKQACGRLLLKSHGKGYDIFVHELCETECQTHITKTNSRKYKTCKYPDDPCTDTTKTCKNTKDPKTTKGTKGSKGKKGEKGEKGEKTFK